MGTRLAIYKEIYYGTKLFGYGCDWEKYKSVQYLLDNDLVDLPDDCKDMQDNITAWFAYPTPVSMSVKQFKEFIQLYAEDVEKYGTSDYDILYEPGVVAILNMEDSDYHNILLTWE